VVLSHAIKMKRVAYLLAAVAFLMSCVLAHAVDPDKDLLIYLPFDEG